jgi:hypothetical protein
MMRIRLRDSSVNYFHVDRDSSSSSFIIAHRPSSIFKHYDKDCYHNVFFFTIYTVQYTIKLVKGYSLSLPCWLGKIVPLYEKKCYTLLVLTFNGIDEKKS